MIRTFLAILFLAALGAAVWFGVMWMGGRSDLEATVIFDSADELVPGNLVVSGSLVIGEVTTVTPLQGKDAVSLRIGRAHRDQVRIDSRFRTDGQRPDAVVRVGSALAFGRPVREGDVLYARESGVSRWIEEKGGALLGRVREQAARIRGEEDLDARLDEWESQIPEWRRQGDEILSENLEVIGERVDELETRMRESGRDIDAAEIRRDFERWIDRVRARVRDDAQPADSTASPAPGAL